MGMRRGGEGWIREDGMTPPHTYNNFFFLIYSFSRDGEFEGPGRRNAFNLRRFGTRYAYTPTM